MKCNTNNCPEPTPPSDEANTRTVNCEAFPFDPAFLANSNRPSAVDVKVPLTDVILEADVEADIQLPNPAREIKMMKKNVSLTQCKAVPSLLDPTGVVKLYITGVVHKNIQYVDSTDGFIRDYSVDVPFSCNRTIELDNELFFPLGIQLSNKNTILERKQLSCDEHGSDRCETGAFTFEIYNEPIECKLIASAVNELDIFRNFDNFGRFDQVTEKMEVLLLFKLYQKQQVQVPTFPPGPPTTVGNEEDQPTAQAPSSLEKFRRMIGRLNG